MVTTGHIIDTGWLVGPVRQPPLRRRQTVPASPRAHRAALFAAALGGGEPADARTAGLVTLASRVSALPLAVAPRSTAARAATLTALAGVAAEVARHAAMPPVHATAHASSAPTAAHAATAHTTAVHGFLAAGHGLLLPAVTGVAAIAVAAGAVGVAAHRSLPGDPFYGVKRTAEGIRQDLAGGGAAGARAHLSAARTRLSEIQALAAERPSATRNARIATTVSSLDHDVALATGPMLAAGPSAIATLRTTVAQLRAGLAALPATALSPVVTRSMALLAGLDAAAVHLLPTPSVPGRAPGLRPTSIPLPPVSLLSAQATPAPGATAVPTAAATGAPSTVPAPRPSSSPTPVHVPASIPPALPSALPTALPTVLPSAIASVVGGLLGGGR
jgi:hypothetical protein